MGAVLRWIVATLLEILTIIFNQNQIILPSPLVAELCVLMTELCAVCLCVQDSGCIAVPDDVSSFGRIDSLVLLVLTK